MTPAPLATPRILGIVNVTPDSFSDGGHYLSVEAALRHIERLIREGADMIDLGAESTRPGAEPVSEADEAARLLPILTAYRRHFDTPFSIDTTKSTIADLALRHGAAYVNDVSAFRMDPAMPSVIGRHGAGAIIMHSIGTPKTMQTNPQYTDLMGDIIQVLTQASDQATQAGATSILVDPGLGFGKTLAHNTHIMRHLSDLAVLGHPILVGPSRKAMIRHWVGDAGLVTGTVGAVIAAYTQGATWFRVHDVQAVQSALAVAHGCLSDVPA
jgi:dihydropteroate synthase